MDGYFTKKNKGKMDKTENRIQAECYTFFNNNYCLKHHKPRCIFFSVPNEAIQNMSMVQIMKFKAGGLRSGVSDAIVVMEGKVIFVEIKTPTGTQSDKQKRFQLTVESLGFKYHLIRSLEQFKTEICEL